MAELYNSTLMSFCIPTLYIAPRCAYVKTHPVDDWRCWDDVPSGAVSPLAIGGAVVVFVDFVDLAPVDEAEEMACK